MMEKLYLIEDSEMKDIEKINEYNEEFIKSNPNWMPFVTEDNFEEFLKEIEDKKQGIGNEGIKEIFYWFVEEGKIIGSGSIRLNPEIDEYTEKVCGHLFYQIIPSKKRQRLWNYSLSFATRKNERIRIQRSVNIML